jgi:hypothetical protein
MLNKVAAVEDMVLMMGRGRQVHNCSTHSLKEWVWLCPGGVAIM